MKMRLAVLVATLGAASSAWSGDGLVLGGIEWTNGLGELTPAAAARCALRTGPLYLEAAWSGAGKIESRSGWLARAAVEARLGPVGLGAAYSHRDGGAWVKRYPWVRASVGTRDIRIVIERALGGYNRETKVELRSRVRAGRTVIGLGVFVERHLQGIGYGSSLMVGIAR